MTTSSERRYLSNSKNWINHVESFGDSNNFDNYKDYFKFAMLWMSFNSYYSSRYKHISGERNQIIEFARDNEEIYNSLLENEISDIVEKFRDTKDLEGNYPREKVLDMRYDSNGEETFNSNKKSLKDFLFVIYQIRCNFFHGNKGETIGNIHDRNLIIWAYKYLDIFWNKFIEQKLA
ncbi:MAG: hypothetical protein RBS77_06140 [Candidatus Moranbacteria bacterium]|nr:hypothetical protein [Candidatus Moranbacteria bacterium]